MIKAAGYSMQGIKFALQNENAARMELLALIASIFLAFPLAANLVEYILLVGIIMLIFAVELLNTAIEAIVDEDGSQTKLYGAAKDCASAAVGVLCLLGLFIWVGFIYKNLF